MNNLSTIGNDKKEPTLSELISNSLDFAENWKLSNQVLYDLCENYFQHNNKQHILAKTLIIGRTYAVALERRGEKVKHIHYVNDDFYSKIVVDKFQSIDLQIDQKLAELKNKPLKTDLLSQIISVHYDLGNLFINETGLFKRSFSSKYLHFHLRDLFFIYDSRAYTALNYVIKKFKIPVLKLPALNRDFDEVYYSFYKKCLSLHKFIEKELGHSLTPRAIDDLLLSIENRRLGDEMKSFEPSV